MDRDLQLMYEIGCLRYIQRAWKQFFAPDFENLAEHHFRVTWIAMLLAKHEGQGDLGKILKMALVHDLAESRTGDVNFIGRLYTERNESAAIKDIFKDTAMEKEMVDLWHEYERYDCIEAKIVKDADNINVDMEIQEQIMRGYENVKIYKNQRKNVVLGRLYTASAKKMWKQIVKSNPSDFHMMAKNRITHGDWKGKEKE